MKRNYMLLLLLLISLAGQAQRTLIHCGSLINGKTRDIQNQVTVVVEGNKILSVDKGFSKPGKDDKLIDLSKKTVMTGLIDMHVHIESETSKDAVIKRYTQNEADIAFQSTIYARKNLMAGFTTVRDCGGSGVNISLRNAVNAGTIVGPRIFTTGKGIATTGGHGDPTNGSRKDLMGEHQSCP
jgi:imidazolonepropionase-like amidohydrolase